jgi:hypothetical protein
MNTGYRSALEDFYDSLDYLHERARSEHESEHVYGSSDASETRGKKLEKPQEPNLDAESILSKIVVERADE